MSWAATVWPPTRKFVATHAAAPRPAITPIGSRPVSVQTWATMASPPRATPMASQVPASDVLTPHHPDVEHDEHRSGELEQQRDADRDPRDRDEVQPLDQHGAGHSKQS